MQARPRPVFRPGNQGLFETRWTATIGRMTTTTTKTAYRVLSIDGGGIRGIIPALVLAELERSSETPIAELFDLIVGTSTGGILALGLTVPARTGGSPANTASALVSLYETEAARIFPGGGPPTLTRRIFGTDKPREWLSNPWQILKASAQRGGAPFGGHPDFAGGSRHFVEGLIGVLANYLGETPLKAAIADVIVTSYDMAYDEPVLFSTRPRPGFVTEASMIAAARATSAGPTYFEPQPLLDRGKQRALVDGGVYTNNPAMLAYVEGMSRAAQEGRELMLLSLGTGRPNPQTPRTIEQVRTSNWLNVARQVMQGAMTGGGEFSHALLDRILNSGHTARYWRFQTVVKACSFAMDDSTPTNVACLKNVGLELVHTHQSEIRLIASLLRK